LEVFMTKMVVLKLIEFTKIGSLNETDSQY